MRDTDEFISSARRTIDRSMGHIGQMCASVAKADDVVRRSQAALSSSRDLLRRAEAFLPVQITNGLEPAAVIGSKRDDLDGDRRLATHLMHVLSGAGYECELAPETMH